MDISIINKQINSWKDILSHHCLCVKFVLRLVHYFYGLVYVKKAMLKGNVIKYMHLKIDLQKCYDIFCSQYFGKMVTYDSLTKLSIFGNFYNREIDFMFEELKNMRWTWHQETGTPCGVVYAYLPLSILLRDWDKPNLQDNKSICCTLLLRFYIFIKPKLTHWYPCLKKVLLLLHRGVFACSCWLIDNDFGRE